MSKKSQILRVPQKKYDDDLASAVPLLGLPHERLIPADTSQKTGIGDKESATRYSGGTGVTSITSTPPAVSIGQETSPDNLHSYSSSFKTKKPVLDSAKATSANTGVTGSTGVSRTNEDNSQSGLKGRTRDVWEFFCRHASESGSAKVRASRRQIQKESGVGSLNTIDSAIGVLQGRGWLRVHPLPGSNEGYEYEVLTEEVEERLAGGPKLIAETLRQAALVLEKRTALTPEQMNKWSRLAHQSIRLIEEIR